MRRFGLPILVLLSLAYPLSARAETERKARVGDDVQGRRLFALHCASCHGAEGKGRGTVATVPPAPALSDPSRMNLISDAQLFRLVKDGGKSLGRKPTMPAFGPAVSDLEIWDLVAYVREGHLSVTDFFPDAAAYFGDRYTIDKWGLERHQALTGRKLKPEDATFTVLGIYEGTQGPEGVKLIPNDPLAVSEIDRTKKIGYVVFVDAKIPGVRGEHILGIGMDKTGLIRKVRVNGGDPRTARKIEKLLARFEGYGRKGMKQPFTGGRSKRDRQLAKAFTEIYSRAMEAVVMFDKAERERHWADEDFGGPKEEDATVEGGILNVKQKRKRIVVDE